MIELKANTEELIEWANDTTSKFRRMTETMKNVAEMIMLESIPLVPLDTSALEQSFQYKVVERSPFILLGVGFDAVDPKSGFHYAYYQHETVGLRHPKRGTDHYLTKGIRNAQGEFFQLIEKDYLSLFNGGGVSRGRTNIDEMLHERFVYFDLEDWIE